MKRLFLAITVFSLTLTAAAGQLAADSVAPKVSYVSTATSDSASIESRRIDSLPDFERYLKLSHKYQLSNVDRIHEEYRQLIQRKEGF